jgi:Flp pilus assembly CpaF family ATPase
MAGLRIAKSARLEHSFPTLRTARAGIITCMLNAAVIQETIAQALAPARPYMEDPRTSELMITADGVLRVERNGELQETGIVLAEHDRVIALSAVAAKVGQDLKPNSRHATVSVSLDGFRFAGALIGVDPRGTALCIRKHPDPRKRRSLENLVECAMLTQQQADTLKRWVIDEELNAAFVGKTSSGKTTLMNALLGKLPAYGRYGVIEDSKELELAAPHKDCFLTNAEAGLTARVLVQLAMRFRWDRIFMGETRGDETFDLIRALSSGHNGSATTLHGSSAMGGLNALEILYQMSIPTGGSIPIEAARSLIASCINLLVYTERRYETQADGRVVSVREVKEIVLVKGVRNGEYEVERL